MRETVLIVRCACSAGDRVALRARKRAHRAAPNDRTRQARRKDRISSAVWRRRIQVDALIVGVLRKVEKS